MQLLVSAFVFFIQSRKLPLEIERPSIQTASVPSASFHLPLHHLPFASWASLVLPVPFNWFASHSIPEMRYTSLPLPLAHLLLGSCPRAQISYQRNETKRTPAEIQNLAQTALLLFHSDSLISNAFCDVPVAFSLSTSPTPSLSSFLLHTQSYSRTSCGWIFCIYKTLVVIQIKPVEPVFFHELFQNMYVDFIRNIFYLKGQFKNCIRFCVYWSVA